MKRKKKNTRVNNVILFYIMVLLSMSWILLISSILVVFFRQPVCPGAMLGPPEPPTFLFVFIGGFIAFCLAGLYAAYRVAFSH